jgi:hypothetical protein
MKMNGSKWNWGPFGHPPSLLKMVGNFVFAQSSLQKNLYSSTNPPPNLIQSSLKKEGGGWLDVAEYKYSKYHI